MITLRPISAATLDAYRTTRLAALADAPLAFGSTFAKESAFTEEQWRQRLRTWNGSNSTCYLAWDEAAPCGIAAGVIDPDDAGRALLLSMWVDPMHRRAGIGRQLVESISEWAAQRQADRLCLSVTSVNDAGLRFYERLGFTKTGRTEPYPNAAGVIEYEMGRPIQRVRS
jgi:ribosomal protein S18 acetylase RimI-like enzyme